MLFIYSKILENNINNYYQRSSRHLCMITKLKK